MSHDLDLDKLLGRLPQGAPVRARGRLRALTGMVLRATVPGATIGEHVHFEARGGEPVDAVVVGFRQDEVLLMPLGDTDGLGPDSAATATGRALELRCGPGLLGRVLDGLGRPIDGGPPLEAAGLEPWPVTRPAPDPLRRPRLSVPLETGVRVIDGLVTLFQGQRVGLFAGSGVGKSRLLGQIAQAQQAQVVVICLVGERGRELRAFLEDALGQQRDRVIVVCATSDAPAMARCMAPFVATAIAEYFRDHGEHVLLLMDSLTRLARAQREVGLAAGEPPVRRGYPPSVFSTLPRLLERAGTSPEGSITGIYTVLTEADAMEDPIADELRGLLDGHLVLSRDLAQRGHWPAVDVLASLSRVMDDLVEREHRESARACRRVLALLEQHRPLIAMGAVRPGSDPELDQALALWPALEAFLQQGAAQEPWEETVDTLWDLFR